MTGSFTFDVNRCTGCGACRLACTIENRMEWDRSWRKVETFNEHRYPGAPLFHHSLACFHCGDAPCMKNCPARAIYRDPETGAVILDQEKCLGCKYCSWACPYDAPVFDESKGVMEKCTLCSHRLKEGLRPACADLCPTTALDFEDLEEEDRFHGVKGFPEAGIQPAVQFRPLRGEGKAPEGTVPLIAAPVDPSRDLPPTKISLQEEWPLVVFTLLVALGFASILANLGDALTLHPLVFMGGAVLGLSFSLAHLGRKDRAHRAILNVLHSWLSREIILVILFVVFSYMYLAMSPASRVAAWLSTILGFIALISVDQVYHVALPRSPKNLHSADVTFTGLFLGGLFLQDPRIMMAMGLLKVMLYGYRKFQPLALGQLRRVVLSVVRVGAGFVLPLVLWMIDPEYWYGLIVAAVLIGEVTDRCEYYMELEIMTPRRQMDRDLMEELR